MYPTTLTTPHPITKVMRLWALILTLCLTTLFLTACQEKSSGPAPLPEMRIGLAPFTQPTTTQELMAGYIPKKQSPIRAIDLQNLDTLFAKVLADDTDRRYIYLDIDIDELRAFKGPVLDFWVQQGHTAKLDLVLVPQVLIFSPRIGGELGVTRAASVMLDFFLIDVHEGTLVHRSPFNETQVNLASNLLDIGTFFSRGGKWLSAEELAQEGMVNVIKEFGL